jgi:NAD(P)-dependent dehydrogenase (short-subunit alcohol dehydrogenase family)
VLWALDTLIRDGAISGPIAAIEVSFQKFIYVAAQVNLKVARSNQSSLRAELISEDMRAATIDVTYGAASSERLAPMSSQLIDWSKPLETNISDIAGHSGWLRPLPHDQIAQEFPDAANMLGRERLAEIAQLSKIIGVVCPGLYSLFSGFAIRMIYNSKPPDGLSFQVRDVDERFRMVEISVVGRYTAGEMTAFLRQPPAAQPGLEYLKTIVKPDEFAGVTALVIGGSRGLGALTSKIIAAGGGRVAITYNTGEADAMAVAEEIGSEASRVLRYDACEGAVEQLTRLTWEIDQLYYFATSHISRQKAGRYSPRRFAEFCVIYVDGFADIWSALRARSKRLLRAFYPSTIYVEKAPRDLIEYAMAKAAGETLCAQINHFEPNGRVIVARLPPLATDQTATVIPNEHADPLEPMLAIVRGMQA